MPLNTKTREIEVPDWFLDQVFTKQRTPEGASWPSVPLEESKSAPTTEQQEENP